MKSEFCTNCGKELSKNASYCANCGKSVGSDSIAKSSIIELVKPKISSPDNKEPVPERSTARKVLGFIAALFVYGLARAAGTALGGSFGLLILLALVLGWLASKLANRYIKKGKIKRNVLKLWAWSNLITWLIPVVGIFTAVFTLKIFMNMRHKEKLFQVLAIIGLCALVINAGVGAVQGMERQAKAQELEQLKSSLDLQEKQLNECKAAIEAKRSSVNSYSQASVDAFNAEVNSCNAIRDTYQGGIDDYNSRL